MEKCIHTNIKNGVCKNCGASYNFNIPSIFDGDSYTINPTINPTHGLSKRELQADFDGDVFYHVDDYVKLLGILRDIESGERKVIARPINDLAVKLEIDVSNELFIEDPKEEIAKLARNALTRIDYISTHVKILNPSVEMILQMETNGFPVFALQKERGSWNTGAIRTNKGLIIF